jgi:hypothetical protein
MGFSVECQLFDSSVKNSVNGVVTIVCYLLICGCI